MDDSMDGGGRTVPGATVEEVACVRNKQSRDVEVSRKTRLQGWRR